MRLLQKTRDGLVDIICAEGVPPKVVIERRSTDNPDQVFLWQPVDGNLSKYHALGGCRRPTRVDDRTRTCRMKRDGHQTRSGYVFMMRALYVGHCALGAAKGVTP